MRYEMDKSILVEGNYLIKDNEGEYTFATFDFYSGLSVLKALNMEDEKKKKLENKKNELMSILDNEYEVFTKAIDNSDSPVVKRCLELQREVIENVKRYVEMIYDD